MNFKISVSTLDLEYSIEMHYAYIKAVNILAIRIVIEAMIDKASISL